MAFKIEPEQRVQLFKIVRIVLIVACFIVVDLLVFRHLSEIRSYNGFVNGPLMNIYPPKQGYLSLVDWEPGQRVDTGTHLGSIYAAPPSRNTAQKPVDLISPSAGIIYEMEHQSGELLNPAVSVMKILNCQNLWVDAFIQEKDVPNIDRDEPVAVRILTDDEKRRFKGQIQFIKYGAEQALLAANPQNNDLQKVLSEPDWTQSVMKLIPFNRKQPNLALVRVKFSSQPPTSGNNFCYAGSKVETVFKRK
ncbi:MAG: HlyD family secretion protein [Vampirovibrio sp.]|nr:HlyD family secretion protein [Vampirovibrio sp.]